MICPMSAFCRHYIKEGGNLVQQFVLHQIIWNVVLPIQKPQPFSAFQNRHKERYPKVICYFLSVLKQWSDCVPKWLLLQNLDPYTLYRTSRILFYIIQPILKPTILPLNRFFIYFLFFL
jgi:hypothetical protein